MAKRLQRRLSQIPAAVAGWHVLLLVTFVASLTGGTTILELSAEPPLVANCSNATLTCRTDLGSPSVEVWWSFHGENVSKLPNVALGNERSEEGIWQLLFLCPTREHDGSYACNAQSRNDSELIYRKETNLAVYVPINIEVEENATQFQELSTLLNLTCRVTGYPLANVQWEKDGRELLAGDNATDLDIQTVVVSDVTVVSSLVIESLKRSDNGTYLCNASHIHGMAYAPQDVLVSEPPEVSLDSAEAQDSRTALLRWHIRYLGNLPLKRFHLQVKNYSTGADWLDVDDKIPPNVTSYTIRYLAPAVTYSFQLAAISEAGQGRWETMNLTMPADVPPKVSSVHVLAYTNETLLFAWWRPSHDNGANITHFIVQLSRDGQVIENKSMVSPLGGRNKHMYLFTSLSPGEQYKFQVHACNVIGCGNWSDSQEASTADGVPDPPENVELKCYFDPDRNIHHMVVHWDLPKSARGTIQSYNVSLDGEARFRDVEGKMTMEHTHDTHKVPKENLTFKGTIKPNTNYSVRVCTINRSGCGPLSNITTNTMCSSPPGVPNDLPRFRLRRREDRDDCQILTLKMERVSERNGLIRCYRIVVIKLEKGASVTSLPSDPKAVNLSSYTQVHEEGAHGAYVAEAFDSQSFVNEVYIGDDNFSLCDTSESMAVLQRLRRSSILSSTGEPGNLPPYYNNSDVEPVYDGKLSPNTNYTGFVEVHVWGPNGTVMSKPSSYFDATQTGSLPTPVATDGPAALIFGVICGVVFVSLALVLFFCLARRKNAHPFEEEGEHLGLTALIRRTIHRNGHVPRGSNLPKLPRLGPIAADDIPSAFIERHVDSDLLFQSEFEALPDKFKDRTTNASDSPENLSKNRYPDIKAYDQTRVRLPLIDGIPGSDYVNANFVQGYKGRKTFICAQGPLDRTVTDFWRMIWEHKVSVIVMLTGIEEHGKVKCAPYWSDSNPKDIEKIFVVTLLSTKVYSDYVVRRLLVQQTIDGIVEEREILQFHFVMWKDFLAPDQPSWLLRFIKRVNEHYSPDRGPLLAHCSAGVGRTGTLVAIDILLQQLEEEGIVDVYSCVYNLRRQRNFLVQSQKQYIFVYRALMEHAQFGDSEIEIRHLRDHYEQLKDKITDSGRSALELEYEKLCEVIEDTKTCCVGSMDINVPKNRYDTIIPYDINRVILPPSPSRDHSSYINASFIQGYDRSLSVIITQDPMENTLTEFWRMVKEQSISTLVMLSELGDGQCKCQKYWPEEGEERDHDYVRVKGLGVVDMSHTIKRTFSVLNTKNNDEHVLTQFHYLGWTGLVPEDVSTFLDLIESTQAHQQASHSTGPITVHCSGGGDRSSVFVTLSVLVQQLKAEERVDIFQAARYTRSQRHAMLQTLAQYHFLYRGLLEYISERKLCDMGDTQL